MKMIYMIILYLIINEIVQYILCRIAKKQKKHICMCYKCKTKCDLFKDEYKPFVPLEQQMIDNKIVILDDENSEVE